MTARTKRYLPIEIAKLALASTAHVTQDEGPRLTAAGMARSEYGWLIWIGGTTTPAGIDWPMSPGLRGAIAAARQVGAQYLLLDRDASELEGVPTYEW